MVRGIQQQSFGDGFAVGEFTSQIKYAAPPEIKKWLPVAKLNDFKVALQKHNYSIVGVSVHPCNSDQVLIAAKKTAPGTNPNLVQVLAKDKHFMDGWEAGSLAGLLRYKQPERVEQWVQAHNMDALQQVIDEYGYIISSVLTHPQDKKWAMLVAWCG